MKGPLVNPRVRRLWSALEQLLHNEFRNMKNVGIVEKSISNWTSPILIPKNKLLIYGDYWRVTNKTISDRYPTPILFGCTSGLCNATIFSYIDLVKSYHNIRVSGNYVSKTAVISPAGLYCINIVPSYPIDLKNTPATFMRFISAVWRDLPFYLFI